MVKRLDLWPTYLRREKIDHGEVELSLRLYPVLAA